MITKTAATSPVARSWVSLLRARASKALAPTFLEAIELYLET